MQAGSSLHHRILLGRLFEICAATHYRRLGFGLVARNLWLNPGEIDLLVRDHQGHLVLVEVRGRTSSTHLPCEFLTLSKRKKLIQLAEIATLRFRAPVSIELLEVVCHSTWLAQWPILSRFCAAWCPEILGIRMRAHGLDLHR